MHHMYSDRRFLTFPSIHPSSAVSPSALLTDLSSLAADIKASKPHLRTHRRAVNDAVRYAAVITSVIDDLCSVSLPLTLPSAAILSLSDLHVTFQKLRLLLSDCARGGARLWVLLNAARVADEFHVLLRSVGPAVEVLPVNSMDVSDETRELVRLLAGQARRIEIKVEEADDRAARSVRSILRKFESGESPDGDDLRRVLNQLDIRSWSDCLGEIGFLEEELFGYEGDCDLGLLWNAIGFMIYSMVVVFDSTTSGNKSNNNTDGRDSSMGFVKYLRSDELRCPISLELMKDPVIVSTGQTYDRSSILRWIKSGNQTCPITGEKLSDNVLIPNSVVKKLIGVYCHENRITISQKRNNTHHKRDLSRTQSPSTPAAIAAIRMASVALVGKLAASSSSDKKNIAAYIIRMLTKSNNYNRICFVEAGSIPFLLNLISTPEPSLQENAIASLLNLSKHHSGRTDIFESAGLSPVVETMKIGHKVETRQNAAAILFYLSAIDDCRRAIGEIPEAIPALVDLLCNGNYRGKKNAIVTLYALLLFPGNEPKVLAAGTVAAISKLIESEEEEEDLVTDCAGLLAKIAERNDGADVILKSGYVVDQLVNLLRKTNSGSGREYCASALLSLCDNGGEKALMMLERMPLLMPCLYSLLSDGSRQASKKARSLLNCMHQFADKAYAGSRQPPAAGVVDPMVHVL